MKKNKNSNIDEMVELFGYDYVIGYCYCSEYDTMKRAEKEEDAMKIKRLLNLSNIFRINAERLMRERMENGL